MIIKGGAAGNIGFWSRHLLRDDTNDEVRLVDISGLMADNLPAALREMQAIARQSRSRGNFMYQANINPRHDEELTPAQWTKAVERLEKNLNLAGHQRIIVEHVKNGRRHRHAIWNRVDVETLKVTDIKDNYAVHARTARELEQMFGLRPTPSERRKDKSAERLWERRAEERSGISREQISEDLTRIWSETTTGRAFREAIELAGYILARGDRRDFCVVDAAGTAHSLARRLKGVSVEEIRTRMADIDKASLPSVAEARKMQRDRNPRGDKARHASAAHNRADKRAFVAAKPEVTRHATTRNGTERQKASGNIVDRFRAGRNKVTYPRLNFGPVQRQIFRRSPKAAMHKAASALMRPVILALPVMSSPASLHEPGPTRPGEAAMFDPSVYGHAEAASNTEAALWQARIDAVQKDRSISPDRRAAAIASLRQQQQLAVRAVRRRIIEEERQRTKAAERIRRVRLKDLTPPKL